MRVFLHYEDNENSDLHKKLKITLPKSWKKGPASNLLDLFVESYNEKFQKANQLQTSELHLSIREKEEQAYGTMGKKVGETTLAPICNDAVVIDEIPDRSDVYICHGKGQTKKEIEADKHALEEERQNKLKNTVVCTHFGCQQRFPNNGPYPACKYHKQPPVFHETAKWWACCPDKKAWDWEEFQQIPGCQDGTCTDIKDDGKMFLGGTDLRAPSEGAKLKSIDDFNNGSESTGSAEAAPVLERLRDVMVELGIEKELFNQVVDGINREYEPSTSGEDELLTTVSKELGSKLKATMKSIAADQLRIK
mmetsp:Transcript_40330/g.40881  ORF Transcript_40330/g.40881 Transcript_40330/m.40881 type:complete len:307 (-) Transcript_40330:1608-2528(-)